MYVEGQPDVLFAGLGQMDLSDYQISLGAAKPSVMRQFRDAPYFSSPVEKSASDLPTPMFWGLGQNYRVPKIQRPVKVRFKYGVPSLAGLGSNGDAGTAIAIGAAGLVVSAVVSFGLMVAATYVGARWAGCRR